MLEDYCSFIIFIIAHLSIFIAQINNSQLFVAHGESWEVAASNAVSNIVKKILYEHNNPDESAQQNGTFALQYTPANANEKAITVPISTPKGMRPNQSGHFAENSQQPMMNSVYTFRF